MSDTQAIFEQVKAIIVDQLGVDADDVTMEASFRDDLEAAAPGRYRGPGADLCRHLPPATPRPLHNGEFTIESANRH